MSRRGRSGRPDPHQLYLDWSAAERKPRATQSAPRTGPTKPPTASASAAPAPAATHAPRPIEEGKRRAVACLPVPRPLPGAVAAGHFGHDEDGRPVRPAPDEVRAITEQHAEKLVRLLHQLNPEVVQTIGMADADPGAAERAFSTGLAAYEEDFGQDEADRLEAYVRRQAALEAAALRRHRPGRGPQR